MDLDQLQKWIHTQIFPPAVVVIATGKAAELVRKFKSNTSENGNGDGHGDGKCSAAGVACLFAPFAGQDGTRPIPVSFFALEKSVTVAQAVVRFVDASDCEAPSDEEVRARLQLALDAHQPESLAESAGALLLVTVVHLDWAEQSFVLENEKQRL